MKYTVVATEILGATAAPGPAALLPVSFQVGARPAWTGAGAVLPVTASVSATALGYALQQAALPVGLSLAGGGVSVTGTALLATGVSMTAAVQGWTYTGGVPVTYLQYLGAPGSGTLTAQPGEFTTLITPASGYPYNLMIPPADGRWVAVSNLGGGQDMTRLLPDMRSKAPLRSRRAQHGQRTRSAYQTLGAR
jgi:hypothetical protein